MRQQREQVGGKKEEKKEFHRVIHRSCSLLQMFRWIGADASVNEWAQMVRWLRLVWAQSVW